MPKPNLDRADISIFKGFGIIRTEDLHKTGTGPVLFPKTSPLCVQKQAIPFAHFRRRRQAKGKRWPVSSVLPTSSCICSRMSRIMHNSRVWMSSCLSCLTSRSRRATKQSCRTRRAHAKLVLSQAREGAKNRHEKAEVWDCEPCWQEHQRRLKVPYYEEEMSKLMELSRKGVELHACMKEWNRPQMMKQMTK
ncbi:hypothetical protein C1H46_020291 [Malus baccata]|uniref:Uncharacterized protein n=1 Tax=Malus baccata TaxID=106549 RepID=A0A540M5W0_MALBA|nr:hypothetical protein C1H46_020291 [Malus baccata]